MRRMALVAAAVVAAAPAVGQGAEIEGPLRFLKPWLKGFQGGSPVAPDATASPGLGSEAPADESPAAAPSGSAAAVRAVQPDPQVAPDATAALPTRAPVAEPAPAEAAPNRADPARAEPAEPIVQPLRLAFLARRNVAATMAALEGTKAALGAAVGRPVAFLPLTSSGAMIDAQILGRVDGGFYSASAYAVAQARCDCLDPIVAPLAFDGTPAFHAIIVAGRSSGIASVADLKGRTVAAGAADSVASRRMQRAALMAEGIDPEADFKVLQDVGSAEAAVRMVAAGQADAAFAWSSLSGDIGQGYSRGTLADLLRRGEIAMADLAVIWHSPPIVHGPVALARSLPDREKAAIRAHLVELTARDPDAYDALSPFYSGGYAAVRLEDYAGSAMLVGEVAAEAEAPVQP